MSKSHELDAEHTATVPLLPSAMHWFVGQSDADWQNLLHVLPMHTRPATQSPSCEHEPFSVELPAAQQAGGEAGMHVWSALHPDGGNQEHVPEVGFEQDAPPAPPDPGFGSSVRLLELHD